MIYLFEFHNLDFMKGLLVSIVRWASGEPDADATVATTSGYKIC